MVENCYKSILPNMLGYLIIIKRITINQTSSVSTISIKM